MEKFKSFIENWYSKHGICEDTWHYELLMKIWEKNFKGASILEKASDLLELLKKEMKPQWNQLLEKFKGDCLQYLFEESGLDHPEAKEKVIEHLTPSKISKDTYKELVDSINKVSTSLAGNELGTFLELCGPLVQEYIDNLLTLKENYKTSNWNMLFYSIQLFGALAGFLILRTYLGDNEVKGWKNCLYAPSHDHYLINPKKTTLILAKTSLNYWRRGGHKQADEVLKRY